MQPTGGRLGGARQVDVMQMDFWYDLIVRELADPSGASAELLKEAQAAQPLPDGAGEDAEPPPPVDFF